MDARRDRQRGYSEEERNGSGRDAEKDMLFSLPSFPGSLPSLSLVKAVSWKIRFRVVLIGGSVTPGLRIRH